MKYNCQWFEFRLLMLEDKVSLFLSAHQCVPSFLYQNTYCLKKLLPLNHVTAALEHKELVHETSTVLEIMGICSLQLSRTKNLSSLSILVFQLLMSTVRKADKSASVRIMLRHCLECPKT